MVVCSTWIVVTLIRVTGLVSLFLARIWFSRNDSIASIVWKRYRGKIRQFEKMNYNLKKSELNFLIKCQQKNVIQNFLTSCLANKDCQSFVTYIKCQQNLKQKSYKQKLITKNHIWEPSRMDLIVWVIIYNLAWTVLILPTFLLVFLVAMPIF